MCFLPNLVGHRVALLIDMQRYWQMTKPTIGLLVVVTVLPTLVMALGTVPAPAIALAAVIGTFLASASAAVFNHVVDCDIDSVMTRTRSRPLPAGRVPKSSAIIFGTVLGLVSFGLLYWLTNPLAAWIAVGANAFYVVGYTMFLKRRTVQNIVIGGAAGAVGPLIGWAAATGTIGWPAWALFLVIFLWTPPHFWSLAIKYKDDYTRAGIPMLPSVQGEAVTRRMILAYTLTLVPAILSLTIFGAAGWVFAGAAGAATAYFLYLAWRLYRSNDSKLAMPVFHYSCLYLFAVFGALALDRLLPLM